MQADAQTIANANNVAAWKVDYLGANNLVAAGLAMFHCVVSLCRSI